MLVSMIARMNAMQRRFDAESRMLNAQDTMMSMMDNIGSGAFSGANLNMLRAMDQKLERDMLRSNIDYQIASLQEKYFADKLAKETQNNRLNLIG